MRHDGVVDIDVGIRAKGAGKTGIIYIQEAVDFQLVIAHTNFLGLHLEVIHGNDLIVEINCKETLGIFFTFVSRKEATVDVLTLQTVMDFLYLDLEIAPLVGIICLQTAISTTLSDGEIGFRIYIGTAVEELEIGIGKKMLSYIGKLSCNARHIEVLTDEDVLFVDGISFT